VEDLQWVAPTTVEWLSLVVDQVPTTSLCMLVTCQPEFQSLWSSRSYLTQMTLNRLPRTQVAQMVGLLADRVTGGKSFSAEVMRHLVEKTDGIPLFVEEMTKTVLESEILTADEKDAARQHLEEGIAGYTPDQRRAPAFRMGQDPGVACRAYAAWPLWILGYPEQALARVHDALALAHELSHPYSLAFARYMEAIVTQFRRDVLVVHEQAEVAVALATEQGFPHWVALGMSLRGWALAMRGRGEERMVQVRQGITSFRATGAAVLVPYYCTMLAEVCDHLSHPEDGLQALAEAHALMAQHEERW